MLGCRRANGSAAQLPPRATVTTDMIVVLKRYNSQSLVTAGECRNGSAAQLPPRVTVTAGMIAESRFYRVPLGTVALLSCRHALL
ncbi:unnamed protein product [Strongylus vulgaris]|uniref:Uncharacterized protein n=1 Tax=Strongylus vulgaris TaxID=40348 RepID=A0A3P7LK36_STRVU|nr:unnamed protein product [Strongylus vulgaris]